MILAHVEQNPLLRDFPQSEGRRRPDTGHFCRAVTGSSVVLREGEGQFSLSYFYPASTCSMRSGGLKPPLHLIYALLFSNSEKAT